MDAKKYKRCENQQMKQVGIAAKRLKKYCGGFGGALLFFAFILKATRR